MEVIFLQDVAGVAKRGEVKQVTSGYAQNFLLPRGLAEIATPGKVAAMKELAERKAVNKQAESEELVQRISGLEGKRITITAKANPKGGLFSAVTAEDIIQALETKLTPEQIVIAQPIKTVGEHIVKVRAGENATATIIVDVKAK